MINYINPYTPGSGRKPAYLAGRDDTLAEAERYIKSTISGFPERSIAYYGLRGVGKTVLLNAIENMADDLNVLYEHIEIKENGNFVKDITVASKKFIQTISLKQNIKDKVDKAFEILKSFNMTWNVEENSFSIGVNDNYSIASDLTTDLTDLLVTLGKLSVSSGNTICFFIDEIQYMQINELEALLVALHRINQLGLPVLVFCAGLPKILKSFGEIKSYAERLFNYVKIDSLSNSEAVEAIKEPAKRFNVEYTEDAVNKILEITGGYPYFIQLLCNTIWLTQSSNVIGITEVINSINKANDELDSSFFRVRYDRCTPTEKAFMVSMVKCGALPCTIANVSSIMKKSVKSISPTRGQLINKGLIYATGHAEIDFTVPQFDKFILRINPHLEL